MRLLRTTSDAIRRCLQRSVRRLAPIHKVHHIFWSYGWVLDIKLFDLHHDGKRMRLGIFKVNGRHWRIAYAYAHQMHDCTKTGIY